MLFPTHIQIDVAMHFTRLCQKKIRIQTFFPSQIADNYYDKIVHNTNNILTIVTKYFKLVLKLDYYD